MNQPSTSKYVPWIAALATAVYFGVFMMPRRDAADDFHIRDFGRLPAIDGGRVKPMDTVARTTLTVLTHKESYYDAETKKNYSATHWLLEALTTPPPADDALDSLFVNGAENHPAFSYEVFRIENDQVLKMLGLKMRSGLRYSVRDIGPRFNVLAGEAERIFGNKRKQIAPLNPKKYTPEDAALAELWKHLNLFVDLCAHRSPLVIPNRDGSDQWSAFHVYLDDVLQKQRLPNPDDPDVKAFMNYASLLVKYDKGDKSEFNKLVSERLRELEKTKPDLMRRMDLEVFFNEFAPFLHCMLLYVLIGVAAGMSWLIEGWSEGLRRAAFASMLVVFFVHAAGLIIRMDLQDRWLVFVTNLYSTAIFIGWAAVGCCLVIERIYRNGIAIVVGSAIGFCTLIVAHFLSLDGDTMEMMQAVLDTNFWLATHVTCITLGYMTTFVAGMMGAAYIVMGIFTNILRKDGMAADLMRMTYGVLCTGMFFSFVGTVLGGIWADQSWGRFWGWDPKENGALLIVLWIAMILHARWGGMVKARGIAVLSELGMAVTLWSYFGTNFLGVGLHAYGFRPGAMLTLFFVDLAIFTIAIVGAVMPLSSWKSFRPLAPMPPAPPAGPSTGIRPDLATHAS